MELHVLVCVWEEKVEDRLGWLGILGWLVNGKWWVVKEKVTEWGCGVARDKGRVVTVKIVHWSNGGQA